jgi:hypothetical protein
MATAHTRPRGHHMPKQLTPASARHKRITERGQHQRLGGETIASLESTLLKATYQKAALLKLPKGMQDDLIRRAVAGEKINAVKILNDINQAHALNKTPTDKLFDLLLKFNPAVRLAAYVRLIKLDDTVEDFIENDTETLLENDKEMPVECAAMTKAVRDYDKAKAERVAATKKRMPADDAMTRAARTSGNRNADEAARRAAVSTKLTDDKQAALEAMRRHADALEQEVIAERARTGQQSVAAATIYLKPAYEEQSKALLAAIKKANALIQIERSAASELKKVTKKYTPKTKKVKVALEEDEEAYRDALMATETYHETSQQRDLRQLADYLLHDRVGDDDEFHVEPVNYGHNVHGFLVEAPPLKCARLIANDPRQLFSLTKAEARDIGTSPSSASAQDQSQAA